jgi:flagellar protein FliJ
MKKFTFRLGSVLRVRRIQEEQAKARLLTANAAAREAERTVDARLARYYDMQRPVGVQVEPQFARTWFNLDTAADAVDVAREQRIAALAVVAERRAEWTDASMRVAALERLEDRQRAEHAVEVQRDNDRLTDDLVVSRYARNHGQQAARKAQPHGEAVSARQHGSSASS